jgi:hypothetical protein
MGVWDYLEVERPAGEWRAFVKGPIEKKGCARHIPISMTRYLDGREVRTEACRPEKVPESNALES